LTDDEHGRVIRADVGTAAGPTGDAVDGGETVRATCVCWSFRVVARRIVMLHSALIAAHAASDIAAFALGCLGLRPRVRGVGGVAPVHRVYLGALWTMVLLLLLVVALDWPGLPLVGRFMYGALSLLALYTGWRGWQALADLRGRIAGWEGAYVDDVGFTLIALFDGFVIIAALDLHAPVWLVLAIGMLGIVIGRYAVQRAKERVAAS